MKLAKGSLTFISISICLVIFSGSDIIVDQINFNIVKMIIKYYCNFVNSGTLMPAYK